MRKARTHRLLATRRSSPGRKGIGLDVEWVALQPACGAQHGHRSSAISAGRYTRGGAGLIHHAAHAEQAQEAAHVVHVAVAEEDVVGGAKGAQGQAHIEQDRELGTCSVVYTPPTEIPRTVYGPA